ncbi:carboxypeptidase regulatory-like domain-containing protein, partial [Candidatus Saccharibacteria bacterium]|nr:carboxypeptidase regulatory-like domain-containing protein [Candidatus Saccharibacteria bacterium]
EGDNNFANTEKELKAKGYNQPNRKYIVWSDAAVYCGIADVIPDSSLGQGNGSNGVSPEFGRVDSGLNDPSPEKHCWGGASEAHELMHTLGAVQKDAPHSTGASHCNDGMDIMCYNDHGPSSSYTTKSCPNDVSKNLYDCHKNDYFNSSPSIASTNYLAKHWNAANSRFLIGSPASTVTPPSNLTANAVSTPEIDLSWSPPTDSTPSGYYITRNGVQIAQVDSNVTTYNDTNLHLSNSYTYAVTAYDSSANTSDASNLTTAVTNNGGIVDTTPPATPTGLFANVVSASRTNLYLPPSIDNVAVTSYDIYRNSVYIATIPSSISDSDSTYLYYDDTAVLPNTSYTYWVIARDAAGNQSAASSKIVVTTPLIAAGLGSITGRTTDIYGVPLASVKISYSANGLTRSVLTNTNGNYVISSLPAGSIGLNLSYSGYNSRSITKKILANDSTMADVNLRKLGSITGLVTDSATGSALPSATVSYQLNGKTKTTKTNSSGMYTIASLSAGTYNLTYKLKAYTAQTKSVQVKLDQTATQDIGLVR